MEFGVFDHLDRHGGALADYYEDRLKIAEAYDRAGFYAYHLAEHHATPLGMAPSPSVFLAAVAQRTTRLRFGPLVWPMPLHHPLRLIEEICMLDQLSGGRLELGFGRGAAPIELEYYGVDPQDAVERPRFHPAGDVVNAEPGVDEDGLTELARRGRAVRRWPERHHYFGGVSLIGRAGAAADPRRSGGFRGG